MNPSMPSESKIFERHPPSPTNLDYIINIVLVKTIYDSNIGASSRAMSNMGGHRLILINPQCEITLKGHQAAAGGQRALENRIVYKSWNDFFENETQGIRISFTAKDGKNRLVQDFASSLKMIRQQRSESQNQELLLKSELESRSKQTAPETSLTEHEPQDKIEPLQIYLIFGPEDWGLSSEDIENTHYSCSIPIYGEHTSLNLAQAVLLALFILRSEWGGTRTQFEGHTSSQFVRKENKPFPDEALKTWITEMGFDLRDRKMNAYSVLKRMILHSIPNEKELRILDIVLHQGIRKLREYNELRKKMGLPFIDRNQE